MSATKKDLTMWLYMFYVCAIILILCGITFLLSSCTEEVVVTDNDKPKRSGKMVEVKFALNSSTTGDPITVSTRNARDMQPETVEISLGDNLYMYATLDIDRDIKLRAATEPLAKDRALRIVAYKAGSSNSNDGYADFTVIDNNGELSGGSLMVEEGESYTFVAYSINLGNLPTHKETLTGSVALNDLLWGSSGIIEIGKSTTVSITMSHKFARVTAYVTTVDPGLLNPPVITNLDSTFISPSFKINLNVKDGDCTIASLETRSFGTPWISQNTTNVRSRDTYIYTDGAPETVITFKKLFLGGYSEPFTNLTAKFKKTLVPGYSYNLYVKIRQNRWAGSNIYWDGNQLTFHPAEDRSNEHYQGVFFKWGSLIGIQPSRSGGVEGVAFANAKKYVPAYNPASPLNSSWSNLNESFWYNILPVTVTSINTDRNNKYLTTMGSDEYYALKGDICQYIGETGAGPKGYRMPTSNEMGTILGSWYNLPGPVAGGWMRVGAVADFENITKLPMYFPESSTSQSGMWVNEYINSYGGNTTSGATYQGAFFPTSGWRDTHGILSHVGMYGYYWTSTIGSNITGSLFRAYNLQFFGNTINPAEYESGVRDSGGSSCAMPIRCIKKNSGEN